MVSVSSYSLFFLVLFALLQHASAFVVHSSSMILDQYSGFNVLKRQQVVAVCMGAGVSVTEEPVPAGVLDKNGKAIQEGSVVRLAVENIKALQVPASGYGAFNEKKEFVPAPADGKRETKGLVLPVGLRGVVSKVYVKGSLSANFPIQVKFAPGEKGGNTDEGYDSPVAFVMHFGPNEVECT